LVYIIVLLKHLCEEFLLVLYLDLASDQALTFVLEDIEEQVGLIELLQSFVDPLHAVAGMKDIKLFLTFRRWLRENDALVLHILFEAPSNVRLAPELNGRVNAHFLEHRDGLLIASLKIFLG